MATNTTSADDDWKEKYFRTVNELDDMERSANDRIASIDQELQRLLGCFRGMDAAFDTSLAAIQDCADAGERVRRQAELVNQARAMALSWETGAPGVQVAGNQAASGQRSSGQVAPDQSARDDGNDVAGQRASAEQPVAAAPRAPQSAPETDPSPATATNTIAASTIDVLRDSLQSLLDHLSVPEVVQAKLATFTPLVQQAGDVGELNQHARDIADVLLDYAASLHSELSALNGFLTLIHKRLMEVTGHLEATREEGLNAARARECMSDSVNESLEKMRGDMREQTDLEALKRSIEAHIVELDGNVAQFVAGETDRDEAASAREVALAQEIEALRSETDELRGALSDAEKKARRDALTGLPNRAGLNHRMAQEIARAQRHRRPLSLAVLDLDRFKSINDTWGHQAGDRVLKHVARELAGRLRRQDFIGRFGGEEFVILLPETGIEDALTLCDALRAHIDACHFTFKSKPVAVTISIGVTAVDAGEPAEHAFKRADDGLYAAKRNGRNRCELVSRAAAA